MRVWCWVGKHWIDSNLSKHPELGWGSYCEECGSSFDVDIEDYIYENGTEVIFGDGQVGIIDGNDSEDETDFDNINYYICPIEFTNEQCWSDHYVMLFRGEFEVVSQE